MPTKTHLPIDRLLRRYDRSGPRYTSYPTVPEWSSSFDSGSFAAFLQRSGADPLSAYVHVPFCEKLCAFCACTRTIPKDRTVVAPFLDALERELDLVRELLPAPRRCNQLALGGGSPNFLDPTELARLVDAVDGRFPPEPGAERSAEMDPRRTTREQLAVLAERGFRRVSFGVQDLDPRVQAAIHREQSPAETLAIVEAARLLGFESVNLDLIYGLPEQTQTSFDTTLSQVIELRPDRIALYGYAHVTWVSSTQRSFTSRNLPSAEDRASLFFAALDRLETAGYRHLGLDHFALAGDELAIAADTGTLHRNFMGYTVARSRDLVAFGPSGISEVDGCYAQSVREFEEWRASIAAGRLATLRGCSLSADDRRRQWLIRSLMCQGTISPAAFRQRFGTSFEQVIPQAHTTLEGFASDGLVREDAAGGWRVTQTGRLFLRSIAMLFDAYLDPSPDTQRYSRVV